MGHLKGVTLRTKKEVSTSDTIFRFVVCSAVIWQNKVRICVISHSIIYYNYI